MNYSSRNVCCSLKYALNIHAPCYNLKQEIFDENLSFEIYLLIFSSIFRDK